MALERMGECHEGEFAESVDLLRLRLGFLRIRGSTDRALHSTQIKLRPDVTGTSCKDNTNVAVGRLHTQRGAENTEQMEISKVVDLPLLIDSVGGLFACAGGQGRPSAEDDGVQTTRRDVVDPFCGEGADRVERGEVDLLGVDELVACCAAQVFNVLDEEEVGGWLFGEEDDLRAACGEFLDDGGSNAGCAAL